jgi:hypothetical protein
VTEILNGTILIYMALTRSGKSGDPYLPCVNMYFGRSYNSATEEMVFTSPQMLELRDKVLRYFKTPEKDRSRWLFSTRASESFFGAEIEFGYFSCIQY